MDIDPFLAAGLGVYGAGEEMFECDDFWRLCGVEFICASFASLASSFMASFSAAAAWREACETGRWIPKLGKLRLFLLVLYGILMLCAYGRPRRMSIEVLCGDVVSEVCDAMRDMRTS